MKCSFFFLHTSVFSPAVEFAGLDTNISLQEEYLKFVVKLLIRLTKGQNVAEFLKPLKLDIACYLHSIIDL